MEIEWLILTDSAQIVDGKLFLLGGGWNQLTAPSLPTRQTAALAGSILLEEGELGRSHTLNIRIVMDDGASFVTFTTQFEASPSALSAKEIPPRFQITVLLGMEPQKTGVYTIIAEVPGAAQRRSAFKVMTRSK